MTYGKAPDILGRIDVAPINHDLSYNWRTHNRGAVSNNPATAQADSYKIVQDDHFA